MSDESVEPARRAFLATAGASALAGCSELLGDDGDVTSTTTDAPETPTPVPGVGWPQVGRGAAHTGYAPEISAADEPTVGWTRSLDGSLATPTVARGSVYVTRGIPDADEHRATLEAYALASGERRWQRSLDAPFRYTAPFSNHRPVSRDGTVYVAGDDALHAVDASSGEGAWDAPVDGGITDPPTVTDDGVYVTASATGRGDSETLVALDRDGAERWRLDLDATGKPRLVAADDGAVYVPVGETLLAVDPASGDVDWRYTSESGTASGAVAVTDGTVVRTGFGEVEAVSTDGAYRWHVGGTVEEDLLRPAVGDETVYVAGVEGTVAAHDLRSGEQRWRTTLGDDAWTQETSPVVVDGALLVPQSDGERVSVVALDPSSGHQQWTVSAPAARIRGPIAAGGRLVATTQNRHVNADSQPNTTATPKPIRSTIRAYSP